MDNNQDQNTMIAQRASMLMTKDEATGRWNGHCLDFDIATSGKDPDRAWKNLRAVVRLHVEHCFTHWQEGLTFKACAAEIDLFDRLMAKQQTFRSEKITFDLAPPKRPWNTSLLYGFRALNLPKERAVSDLKTFTYG